MTDSPAPDVLPVPPSAKLLLVDDDPGMIQVLGRILAEHPHQHFATSGADALRLARQEQPDLILLDAMMAGMDGFAVCTELKRDASTAHIPVIFITGRDEAEVEASVFELGAADFIGKPVNPAVVRARVGMQLRLRRMTAELQRLAMVDPLTGLANRRSLDARLEAECRRAARNRLPLSLLMVDVDHFKAYNDLHGHPAGDACLQQVGMLLRGAAQRPGDLAARWGGEEFALLLPDTDALGAATVAQRLLQGMARLALPHGRSPVAEHVTLSIGLSAAEPGQAPPGRPVPAAALPVAADQALYAAKAAGRAQAWLRLAHEPLPRPLLASAAPAP